MVKLAGYRSSDLIFLNGMSEADRYDELNRTLVKIVDVMVWFNRFYAMCENAPMSQQLRAKTHAEVS